jgi:hypothetical protein
VGLSFHNEVQEITSAFYLNLLSHKHTAKFSISKDHPYAKVSVSSPLMPWITLELEAELKRQDKEFNLVNRQEYYLHNISA